jgi:DNA helicase HerA-like ATPase
VGNLLVTLGEENGKILLVSKRNSQAGILPRGSYITVLDNNTDRRFILRVDESLQINSFNISPMLSDMNLKPLLQDQGVKNLIRAVRIREFPPREDGLSSYIRPLLEARKSTQEEIDYVLGTSSGVPVFLGSHYAFDCQVLKDENGKSIRINLPDEMFFHQTLITGATGSGKTAAMKYLAQYFVEDLKYLGGPGAVLAINVKEEDFLYMDKPTVSKSSDSKSEWHDLGFEPHGVDSFRVYYPGKTIPKYSDKVDSTKCEGITIKVENLEPEDLVGIIQNLTVKGAEQIVDIFRYWKAKKMKDGDTMRDFISYFDDPSKQKQYTVLTLNGDEYQITMHSGTFNSLRNSLIAASNFFDAEGAKELTPDDILERRKLSVIDLSQRQSLGFGSILLRNILYKIYNAKSSYESDVPVLILIDEVHEFYSTSRSREALGTIDAIARKGRSLGIGVVFSSQNIEDIPAGISKVVNSKIHFKGYVEKASGRGIDTEALRPGFAKVRIYGLNFVDLIKFPLPLGGLYE